MNNTITKNVTVSLMSQLFTTLLLFITRKIFLEYLSIELLGISNTFTSVLSTLSLAELGFQTAIVYSLYLPLSQGDINKINKLISIYKSVYRKIALFILISGLCVMYFIRYILNGVDITYEIYIIYLLQLFNIVFSYLLSYRRTLLYANQQEYITKLIDTGCYLVFCLLRIFSVTILHSYYIYLLLQIIQTITSNILVHRVCVKKYVYLNDSEPIDRSMYKSLTKNVKNVFVSKLTGYIYSSTDDTLISILISTVQVGYIGNYKTIINAIKVIGTSILSPIAPFIGKMLTTGDNKKALDIFYRYTFIRYLIASTLLIPTLILCNSVIINWIGYKYLISPLILLLMIADLYIHFVHSATIDYINGAGLFSEERIIDFIGATINLLLSIIYGNKIGLPGIFWGTIFSQIFFWLTRSYLVIIKCLDGGYINLMIYYIKNIKYIIIFILSYMCLQNICIFFINYPFIIYFILCGLVCVVFVNLVNILLNLYTPECKWLLHQIYRMIKDNKKRK